MQSHDELIKLMNQAASAANMLSCDDLSDAGQLDAVFSRISGWIAEASDGSDQQLEQLRNTADRVSGQLRQIQQTPPNELGQIIDTVSKSVMEMQDLVNQVANAAPAAPPKTAPSQTAEIAEAAPQTVIPEEDVPLVQDFIAESGEHIESAEAGLLALETKPEDAETLNLIFRGFHTIKGMAGFLNLTEIGTLAHRTENLLDLARKGHLTLSGRNTDLVFEAIDLMKKMMDRLRRAMETQTPLTAQQNMPALLERLEAAIAGQSGSSPASPAVEARPQESVNPPAQPQAPVETTEPVCEKTPLASSDVLPKAAEDSRTAGRKVSASDEKIKVSTDRLDKLVNMAGELVIAQLMVAEEAACQTLSAYEINRRISHQGKIIRELQELSMSMRMVEISGVFQKMARLVRDVSRKAEKTIDFITEGEETELDRSIVDKIADPLIHMLRNSVDHGVEPADVRKKAGKNPVGRIELRAFHQAGNIVIEIADDGKGLDKDRILQKAVDQGVVEPDQPLTDDQIYKLIFHPGLSTAEKVTSVSGRGVGMDVVKKNIESLRGRIDIVSTPGQGTVFTIRLPLTLAMIDGQIVTVGDSRYIIPINSIVRSLRPLAEQISTVQNRFEMVLVRGQLMPLIRLYRLFSVPPASEDPTEALLVIVEDDDRQCCLMVDDLLAQQRVVIKNLGEGLGKVECVSGGAIMGDGKVSLILDVPGLIKLSQQ